MWNFCITKGAKENIAIINDITEQILLLQM